MSMFNKEQEKWMEYLATLPPEKKCDCGWNNRGDCFGQCYGFPEKGGAPKKNLDEQSEKIGNQIGVGTSAQTPTPVGRAGSLPGSAQAGSPNSYLAELSYLDEIVDKAYERANQWIPRMSEGAQRATDVAVKEIIKRACQDWGQFRWDKGFEQGRRPIAKGDVSTP